MSHIGGSLIWDTPAAWLACQTVTSLVLAVPHSAHELPSRLLPAAPEMQNVCQDIIV